MLSAGFRDVQIYIGFGLSDFPETWQLLHPFLGHCVLEIGLKNRYSVRYDCVGKVSALQSFLSFIHREIDDSDAKSL